MKYQTSGGIKKRGKYTRYDNSRSLTVLKQSGWGLPHLHTALLDVCFSHTVVLFEDTKSFLRSFKRLLQSTSSSRCSCIGSRSDPYDRRHMTCAWILNVAGLIVSTVAAVLMYYFPPRVQLVTEKGEPVVTWTSNARPEKQSLGKWQARLSKVGPAVLVVGFLMQLTAAFLSP